MGVTHPESSTPLDRRMAEEVRVLMLRRGAKQADLARVLGVNQGAISHRLTGRTIFTVRELGIIAEYFGVSPAALLGVNEVQAGDGIGLPSSSSQTAAEVAAPAALAPVTPLFAGVRGRRHTVDIATRPLAPVLAFRRSA